MTRINGKNRVESVEIQNLDSGVRRTVHWDTVITTRDWIPDDELARSAGLDVDPATRGPASTAPFAPAHPGVFAAGNLLHPVDTADIAALDGRTSAPRSGNGCAPTTLPAPASP